MTGAGRSLLAVRHCASSGQAPDAPLTTEGRAQADRLAEALSGEFAISRIVSSPYLRARETAAPLAARLGLGVEPDDRLAEHRLASAPLDDWLSHVARAFADPDARAPGGDSARETLARAWSALTEALAAPGTLVVSHGQLLSLVLQHIDPSFGFAQWREMRNPDVFRIRLPGDGRPAFERVSL